MSSELLVNQRIAQETESPPGDADADLATRARSDPQAFAALYLRYVDAIHAHCHWRLGSREVAEDATSQVFAQALAGLPRFDSNRGTFRSWLFTIAHHVVIDHYRKTKPATSIDAADDLPDIAATPEEIAVATERSEALRAALDRLPPRERQVVELRLAGLTGPEISSVLGCSTAAIGAAQYRAVVRLRSLMGLDIQAEGTHDV
jgi:RNA polymerase sigma-70 factor (ECF subfamily)